MIPRHQDMTTFHRRDVEPAPAAPLWRCGDSGLCSTDCLRPAVCGALFRRAALHHRDSARLGPPREPITRTHRGGIVGQTPSKARSARNCRVPHGDRCGSGLTALWMGSAST